MKPTSRPTIAKVALACKVSKATVSKALSLPPEACPVSPVTRERILRAASQMGYRPGWLASALTRGRTGSVALLYVRPAPPMSGQYFELFQEMHRTLEQANVDLVLQRVEDGSTRTLELLRRGRYDGAILFEHVPQQFKELLLADRLPVVLLNAYGPAGIPSVCPDDRQAAQTAVAHLLGHGHRKLIYWHGLFLDDHESTRIRAAECIRAASLGRAKAEERVQDTDELARDLAEGSATAVICFHEVLAARLVQACTRRSIRVPGDVSILTFNDTQMGELLVPPLSAVRLPVQELGRQAAAMLLAHLDGRKGGSVIIPVTEVIQRDSTAPPRASRRIDG